MALCGKVHNGPRLEPSSTRNHNAVRHPPPTICHFFYTLHDVSSQHGGPANCHTPAIIGLAQLARTLF
jgi:hypothetical protein